MSLKTFLQSGFNFKDSEYELKLFYTLFNTILSSVILMLSILLVVRLLQEDYVQVVINLFIIFFSLYTIFYIRKSKVNVYRTTPFLLFIFFFLVSYAFINHGMYLVGASWFIIFLLASFFLAGMKTGLFYSILSVISFSILSFIGEDKYTAYEFFYVISPMIMGILFIYLYERRDTMIKELLYKKNDSLEKDIELKSHEQMKLLQKSHELAQIFDNSNIELYIVDMQTDHFLYVNKGVLDALGYTKEEMLTKSVYDINPSLTVETVKKLKELSIGLANIMNITQHQRKDGTKYGVQSYIHTITYDNKEAYVIYDIKISDENRAKEEILRQKQSLAKQAYYDALTSLPNRVLFYDRLSQAITKSKRSNKEFALMFIDLDKFKEVNDSLGHEVGDEVLVEVASRLKDSLREVDTVARLAGDEFLVIIEDIGSKESVVKLVKKLLKSLSNTILASGHRINLTSSIGISLYPDHTQEPKTLIKHADKAMYQAKSRGKNNYEFYNH